MLTYFAASAIPSLIGYSLGSAMATEIYQRKNPNSQVNIIVNNTTFSKGIFALGTFGNVAISTLYWDGKISVKPLYASLLTTFFSSAITGYMDNLAARNSTLSINKIKLI